jgi:PAS domain S-box-containing protein
MAEKLRKSGIPMLGDMPWGTHFCLFYETKRDLLDLLIPYFTAGLENHEFCLCIASEPVIAEEAQGALRKAVPNFDRYLAEGQIEIVSHREWYLSGGHFDPLRVRQGWIVKLEQALARGYEGMRFAANIFWLEKQDWDSFAEYEEKLNEVFGKLRIMAVCAYSLARSSAADLLDVVRHHQFSAARRHGAWERLEGPELQRAHAEIRKLNAGLERRVGERTAQLAAANDQLTGEIAERRRSEEALRQREFDLAEAQRVARLGSWSLDVASNTVRWSEELYRIFDLEKTAFGGTHESFLSLVHPDDRTRVLQVNAEARSRGEPFEVEYRITTQDGQLKHIREVGYARRDSAGAVSGLFGTAQDVTERRQAQEALRDSAERLQHLSHRLLQLQEEERRHLARELHDEFGQILATITLHLHAARGQAGEAALRRLDECARLLRYAGEQVRNLALELRPTMLDTLGLEATLRWLAEQHQQRTGTEVQVVGHLSGAPLSGEVAIACFRVAQEALTNVVRHAQPKHVWIEVSQSENALELAVRDDGPGFNVTATLEHAARRGKLGLLGMQERVQTLGGSLKVESQPGHGTRIHATFPLTARPDEQPAEAME